MNGIFFVLRGGNRWPLLPTEMPPKRKAFGWFSRQRDDGPVARLNLSLVMSDHERVGGNASPTAVAPDSQSVKTTNS